MSVQNPTLVKTAQLFSTTVFDVEGGQALDVTFLRARSFAPGTEVSAPAAVLENLGGRVRAEIAPNLLAYALTGLIELKTPDDPRVADLPGLAEDHPDSYDFAVTLAETLPVPIKQSPLSGETVAALAQASPVGAGVLLGVLASATAPSWVVIVMIPSGIILYSVAGGIGDGIRSAARRLTEELIVGKGGKRKI